MIYDKIGAFEVNDGLEDYVTREVAYNSIDPLDRQIILRLSNEPESGVSLDQYQDVKPRKRRYQVLLTVQECWSGYSEYSITKQWQEVWITIPERGYTYNFGSFKEFFTWLAEYNDGRW